MAWFLTESKPCPWSTTAEALPQRSWRCPPEIVEVFYTLFQNGLHSGRLGSGSVVVFPATCSWCFLPPVPGISYQLFLVFPATCSWYFLPAVPGISYQQFLVFPASFWYFLPPVPGISCQFLVFSNQLCSQYFLPVVECGWQGVQSTQMLAPSCLFLKSHKSQCVDPDLSLQSL